MANPCYCDGCIKPKSGLYQKFRVERIVGTDKPGEEFLVLSPTHDPFARESIRKYADECQGAGLFDMANDLYAALDRVAKGEPFRQCPNDSDSKDG